MVNTMRKSSYQTPGFTHLISLINKDQRSKIKAHFIIGALLDEQPKLLEGARLGRLSDGYGRDVDIPQVFLRLSSKYECQITHSPHYLAPSPQEAKECEQ